MPLIFLSSLLGMLSNTWLMIWSFMEINTILMSTLMFTELKKSNKKPTATLLYLMIQLISSAVLLSIYWTKISHLGETIMIFSLLMKVGSWPLHLWYTNTLQLLNMKTKSFKIIMTWQKLLPFFLMSFFTNMEILLLSIVFMNLTLPTTKLKKEMNFKYLLVISSIFNSAWFILAIMSSLPIFLIYFFIYSTSLIFTVNFFHYLKTKTSPQPNKFWQVMIMMGNMSGFPPSMIFVSKFMILSSLMLSNMGKEILFLVMMMNCLFIYHYMWSSYSSTFSSNHKSQLTLKTSDKSFLVVLGLNISGLLLFILDFPMGLTLMG